jgi:HlyD family secretion protein
MSPTMFLGRVVLPLIGLALAALLAWQFATTGAVQLPPALKVPGWDGGTARAPATTPGPRPKATAKIVAEGRVVAYPGAEVAVGAEVGGAIVRVPVQEGTAVRKGDLLAEFKADDVQASVREAISLLAEAEAEIAVREREGLRLDRVLSRGVAAATERGDSRPDLAAARARRDAAKAALERLEALRARYRILSPIDGVVIARHADPGETVPVAAPLVTVADLRRLRVEAEVDEFDIGCCAPGARATITAEGYRGRSWRGVVEQVADAVVGRSLRPDDPGRPSDTRVLPVKIALREPTPLKLGQRVEVEIAVRDEPAAPARPEGRPARLSRR